MCFLTNVQLGEKRLPFLCRPPARGKMKQERKLRLSVGDGQVYRAADGALLTG